MSQRKHIAEFVLCLFALLLNGCFCWLTGNCDETLNPPSSPTPLDGAVDQPTRVLLTWQGGDSPSKKQVTYDLYFGVNYPPALWQHGLTAKSYDMDSLSLAKTYYWQVHAIEKGGKVERSPIWSFSTAFPPRFLTVDFPNWATNWARGETRTIQWRSAYAGSQVKLDLYKAGGRVCVISGATLNDGYYDWQLAECADQSDADYRVRVTSLLDTTLFDESDFFTVTLPCPIEVLSPKLRELWIAGESRTIEWRPLGLGTNIKVSLHLYKGYQFVYIVAPVTADDGSYEWVASDFGAGSGPDYRIRISDLNEFDCSRFSDFFTLQACSVRVESPAAGQYWPLGSQQTIIWDPTYLASTVSLELYHDGEFVCVLDESTPNTGSYLWTATRCESVFGENFQIKILSGPEGACGFSGRFRFRP